MEKQNREIKKAVYKEYYSEFEEISLSDYCNFKLQKLAQRIKLKDYRPKPKMLYL